jgi:DNA (cytosine-5)-methyltransferase 1
VSSGRHRPTCVSLFSGCGGLDLGLQRAGFHIVGATDSNENCEISHKRNFPSAHFLRMRAGEFNRRTLFTLANCDVQGQLDLLAGGPPCQPFSKSRFYRKEKLRSLADPQCNETITGYLNALRWLRPKAFLLENVKGLAYRKHSDALDEIKRVANSLGYKVETAVVNAADFGVPQIRERCFVVGSLAGTFEFPSTTHSQVHQRGLKRWVTAGDVLSDLDTRDRWSDIGHRAGGRHHELLRQVPPGQNYLCFTAERGCQKPLFRWRSRYWSFLLKLSPDLPSWTVQARRSNNMGPFHWRNRILRIDEVKRLQTFPLKWHLAGTVEDQWRQLGNAVPPLLAAKMGAALIAHLRNNRQVLRTEKLAA